MPETLFNNNLYKLIKYEMHEMQLDHDPDIAPFGTWNLTPQVAYSPHLAPRKQIAPFGSY
jgi:hypothetical protein